MLQSQTDNGIIKISLLLFIYFIKYITYALLMFIIAAIFSIILIILITIFGSDLSFEFLRYFSVINPALNQESFSMDIGDIMQLYFIITLILLVVIEIIKYSLKKIFKWEFTIDLRKKLFIIAAITTIIYLIAILLIPWMKIAKGQDSSGFYLIFIFLYLLSLVASATYLTLNKLIAFLYKSLSQIS